MLKQRLSIIAGLLRLSLACLVGGVGGSGSSLLAAPPAQVQQGMYAEVVTPHGEVYACATGTGCTTRGTKGMRVFANGEIRTGPNGSVDLQTKTTVFRVERQATLQFQQVDNAFTRLILKGGRLFVNHDAQGRDVITVQAGSKRLEAADTQFSVAITDVVGTENDPVAVAIPKGGGNLTVAAESGQEKKLWAGYELDIPADAETFPDVDRLDAEEQAEWDDLGEEWEDDPDLDAPDTPQAVPQTGYTIASIFTEFWNTHGAVELFGYPIAEAFFGPSVIDGANDSENQCFERGLLEYHPEFAGTDAEVLIAPLGVYAYTKRYGTAGAPNQVPNQTPGHSRFFPETGQWLGGQFQQFWETRGDLAQFGYPISDEFVEPDLLDPSQTHTVQYFERAVFEHHPEFAGSPFEVSLARLGSYYCTGAEVPIGEVPPSEEAGPPDEEEQPTLDETPTVDDTPTVAETPTVEETPTP